MNQTMAEQLKGVAVYTRPPKINEIKHIRLHVVDTRVSETVIRRRHFIKEVRGNDNK